MAGLAAPLQHRQRWHQPADALQVPSSPPSPCSDSLRPDMRLGITEGRCDGTVKGCQHSCPHPCPTLCWGKSFMSYRMEMLHHQHVRFRGVECLCRSSAYMTMSRQSVPHNVPSVKYPPLACAGERLSQHPACWWCGIHSSTSSAASPVRVGGWRPATMAQGRASSSRYRCTFLLLAS